MEDFINVIRKDHKVRNKVNVMLDGYMSLPYDFQSKRGYNSLIQNVILKKKINIMAMTINDSDIEVKKKFSRIRNIESKLLYNFIQYK